MVENTPYSRSLFEKARDDLNADRLVGLQKAHAVFVVILHSFEHTAYAQSFGGIFTSKARPRPNIAALHSRIQNVILENMCAVQLLRKLVDNPDAVIYLDPPYPGTRTAFYGPYELDYSAMRDVIRDARARICISGYGDFWNDLGWERRTYNVIVHGLRPQVKNKSGKVRARTETIWMNYEPPLGIQMEVE